SQLAKFRWQDITKDIAKVWKNIEEKAFTDQLEIEKEAERLYKENPEEAKKFLTKYCLDIANQAVKTYWKLGDDLWAKYTRYF
ncbi:MAG: hypothetical protein U9Q97_02605, partial [Acidobacteriota bacterium]|nr:hypothetical protein [Acidobacteriota bacterium]